MTKISSLVSRFMQSFTKSEASVESATLAAKRRNRWAGLDSLEDRKMLAADFTGVVVNFSAATFTPGQTVFASVFYQNTDVTTAAGPHTVKLYRSQNGVYDAGTDTLLASTVVSSLAAGGAKSVQFSWIASNADAADDASPTNGTATTSLVAVIDEEDSVPENTNTLVIGDNAGVVAGYTVTVPVVSVLGAAPGVPGGSDLSAVEGTTNSGKFVLSRTGATTLPLTVTFNYSASGATVTTGDFSNVSSLGSQTVTFGANQSTVSVSISPVVDTNTVAAESTGEVLTLTVVASPAVPTSYTVGTAAQSMTIVDTHPTVSITATDRAAGEASTNTASFRVSRTGPTTQAVDVLIDFNNGGTTTFNTVLTNNANIGADFVATVGSTALAVTATDQVHVIIPANRTYVDMKIIPIDDVAREGNEIINPTIQANALLTYGNGTVSDPVLLVDNDIINLTSLVSAPIQSFTSPTTSKNQTIRFTITIANASAGVSVPTTVSVGLLLSSVTITGGTAPKDAFDSIIPLQTFSIGSLRAGQVLVKNFTMRLSATSAIPAGLYRAAAKVDAGNAIIEDPSVAPSLTAAQELDNYGYSGATITVA